MVPRDGHAAPETVIFGQIRGRDNLVLHPRLPVELEDIGRANTLLARIVTRGTDDCRVSGDSDLAAEPIMCLRVGGNQYLLERPPPRFDIVAKHAGRARLVSAHVAFGETDNRNIAVEGDGGVELRIGCQIGSRQSVLFDPSVRIRIVAEDINSARFRYGSVALRSSHEDHVVRDLDESTKLVATGSVGSGKALLRDPSGTIEAKDVGDALLARSLVSDDRRVAVDGHRIAKGRVATRMREGQFLLLYPFCFVALKDIGGPRFPGADDRHVTVDRQLIAQLPVVGSRQGLRPRPSGTVEGIGLDDVIAGCKALGVTCHHHRVAVSRHGPTESSSLLCVRCG